ncbi:single-stranded DNA-binding protein [Actinoplanes sp. NPDC051343]|uniref:single-stranded DNA-binding protein n=1 Tax=Actinoplanes sp. NPDC051343 TaxID=3363906 RepID=UPI0037A546A7
MFDTNLVVVGNVLTAPEWRRLKDSGSLVANFRVASTARRFDRDKAQWVDSNSFRVRVTAWRRLAEGVASSIAVGDPVVVYGRLYNRDWKDEQGNNRVSYEMEAFSIGHDLARGRAKFFRTRLAQMTSEIESAEAETFVRGETSVPLTADEAPVVYGDGLPDQLAEQEPTFVDVAPGAGQVPSLSPPSHPPSEEAGETGEEPLSETEGTEEESPSDTDDLTLEVERLVAEQQQPASTRRRGRSSKREPVSA